MKIIEINFVYIENTFIYKYKDILKYKNNKTIVNFLDISDKLLSKNLTNSKFLIGSLVIKKINKIINRSIKQNIKLYYVISKLDTKIFDNVRFNISKIAKENTITYNLYTDSKTIVEYKELTSCNKLEKLFQKDEYRSNIT